jgi:Tol biopolymer transport system component
VRSALLVVLALGAALVALVALAGVARQAEAALTEKIVFVSERTMGTGVDNPTGDPEIFTINPDGTGLKQLTFNTLEDYSPVFSPDGTKIVYTSRGDQTSNSQLDYEVYVMSSLDGTGKVNLTNNGTDVADFDPEFSPDGQWIAYESRGTQTSNPEGDYEVYRMNALDGTVKKNLSNNGRDVGDFDPVYSPDGTKIAYRSSGKQTSNPEGDYEVYRMNALDGTGQINLSNNGTGVSDGFPVYSPGGTRIAYYSSGIQTSNPQGDGEVYRMNTLDGTGKKNLSNNGSGVNDYGPVYSPDGTKIAYYSEGNQTSNPQGDGEVYRMNALDGLGKKNLSNNGRDVGDSDPVYSPDGTKIAYRSRGNQTSNPQGDGEVYRMNALDGLGKKNLSNNDASDSHLNWGRQAM